MNEVFYLLPASGSLPRQLIKLSMLKIPRVGRDLFPRLVGGYFPCVSSFFYIYIYIHTAVIRTQDARYGDVSEEAVIVSM